MNLFLLAVLLALGGSSHVVTDVPFVRQESAYCGPASLSSVFAHYGEVVDQKTIAEAVYDPKLQGSLITDLQNYARTRGFQATAGLGGTADIKQFLIANRPVIVLVDSGFWVISKPHYLVIYGFTEQGFLAHDGFTAAQLFPYGEFENIWQRAGRSFLLVYR